MHASQRPGSKETNKVYVFVQQPERYLMRHCRPGLIAKNNFKRLFTPLCVYRNIYFGEKKTYNNFSIRSLNIGILYFIFLASQS